MTMFSWVHRAVARASTRNRWTKFRIAVEQELDRDLAAELGVAGEEHLPMPPRPSSRIISYCLIRVPAARSTPGSVVLLVLNPVIGVSPPPTPDSSGPAAPPASGRATLDTWAVLGLGIGVGVAGPTPNCVPTGGSPRSWFATA